MGNQIDLPKNVWGAKCENVFGRVPPHFGADKRILGEVKERGVKRSNGLTSFGFGWGRAGGDGCAASRGEKGPLGAFFTYLILG